MAETERLKIELANAGTAWDQLYKNKRALAAAAQSVLDYASDSGFGELFETCNSECDCCLCDLRKALKEMQ